jgi:hypothetical protein
LLLRIISGNSPLATCSPTIQALSNAAPPGERYGDLPFLRDMTLIAWSF